MKYLLKVELCVCVCTLVPGNKNYYRWNHAKYFLPPNLFHVVKSEHLFYANLFQI